MLPLALHVELKNKVAPNGVRLVPPMLTDNLILLVISEMVPNVRELGGWEIWPLLRRVELEVDEDVI